MIKLKPLIYKQKIDLDPEIAEKFKYPIIFYTRHKKARDAFLISLAIVDFNLREIKHVITYAPENIAKVKESQEISDDQIIRRRGPHSCIQINEGVDYYVFFERSDFFFYVNIEDELVVIYTGKDIQPESKNVFGEFGATFFKNPSGNNSFYLTNISTDKEKNNFLNFYEARLDLSDIKNILSYPVYAPIAPHATKRFGDYLLNSEFNDVTYMRLKTKETVHGTFPLVKRSYEDLYRDYCKSRGLQFSIAEFEERNKITRKNLKLEKDFENFCHKDGKNFYDMCQSRDGYAFRALPGKISVVSLKNKTIDFFNTTYCAPAHFEINEKNNLIYTSSHNFCRLRDEFYYLGPAAIDKFYFMDGKLEKKGTFTDRTAYRFTTHKLFDYGGKSYLCSFGQPNRFFLIDADTMELVYYLDIGKDVLSDKSDVRDFLNKNKLEIMTMKAFEASQDGELLFIVGNAGLYFLDIFKQKIIGTINYKPDVALSPDLSLADFCRCTTHCDFLL